MTVATVTICGVVIEAGDWPEGVDWFDADGTWQQSNDGVRGVFVIEPRFHPDNLYCAVFWLRDNAPECAVRGEHRKLLPWIAARCRCRFLDRAEEEYKAAETYKWCGAYNQNQFGYDTTEHFEWQRLVRKGNALSASAAKWAQIGRNACKR